MLSSSLRMLFLISGPQTTSCVGPRGVHGSIVTKAALMSSIPLQACSAALVLHQVLVLCQISLLRSNHCILNVAIECAAWRLA